jgi:hypothetical protein
MSNSSSTRLGRPQNNNIKFNLMRQNGPTWEDIGMPQELREHATILLQHFVRKKLFSKVKFITTERQLLNTGMYYLYS